MFEPGSVLFINIGRPSSASANLSHVYDKVLGANQMLWCEVDSRWYTPQGPSILQLEKCFSTCKFASNWLSLNSGGPSGGINNNVIVLHTRGNNVHCNNSGAAASFLRFFAALLQSYMQNYDHPLEALLDMPPLLNTPNSSPTQSANSTPVKSSPSRLIRRLTMSRKRSINFSDNLIMNEDGNDSDEEESSKSNGKQNILPLSGSVVGGWPTPSQRRYMQNFYQILRSSLPVRHRVGLRLTKLRLIAPPLITSKKKCVVKRHGNKLDRNITDSESESDREDCLTDYVLCVFEDGIETFVETESDIVDNGLVIEFDCHHVLSGDVVLAVYGGKGARYFD